MCPSVHCIRLVIGTVSVAQHYVGGCGKGRGRSRCRGSKSRTSGCGRLTSGVAHHPYYYQTGHVTVTHVSVDGTNANTGSWCFRQESSYIEVIYRSSGQQSQHLRVTCVCLCNRSLNCPSCRLWFHSPRWLFTEHAFSRRLLFIFWEVWTRRFHEGAITCRSLHV